MLANIEEDISGSIPASGMRVLDCRPLKGTWGSLLLIAQTGSTETVATAGTASWTVLKNGSPVAIGKGTRCSLGPLLLEPNDKVQLLVVGATPGVNVTGHFVGVQSDVGLSELPIPPPLPNTITIESIELPETLNTSVIVNQATQVVNVLVSSGVQELIINVLAAVTLTNFSSLEVRGKTTGSVYFFTDNTLANPFSLPVQFAVNPSLDSSYTFTWKYSIAPVGDTWLIGQATATRMISSRLWSPTVSHGDIIIGADQGSGKTASGRVLPGSGSLNVSHFYANPAPWQGTRFAPVTINTGGVAAGAFRDLIDFVNLSPPNGPYTVFYLLGVLLTTPTAGATWCTLNMAGLTEFVRVDCTNVKGIYIDFKGAPIPIPATPNNKLQLFNGGVGPCFWNGTIIYNVSTN